MDVLIFNAAGRLALVIAVIAVIAVLVVCAWIALCLRIRRMEQERDEDFPPECMKTCVYAAPECRDRDEECAWYQPKPVKKHYDPKTGEVWCE